VSIIGFSTILSEKWATLSEKDRQKYMAIIDRKSRVMSALIDDLLTVSRIESGALDTQPELIALGEAISQCLETASDDTADVSVSCSPDLFVHADPQHLGRIIDNYLRNALQYGEAPVRIDATKLGDMIENPGPRSWSRRTAGVRAQAVRQVRTGRHARHEGQRWDRPRTFNCAWTGRGQRRPGTI